jgi:hypothetical protein
VSLPTHHAGCRARRVHRGVARRPPGLGAGRDAAPPRAQPRRADPLESCWPETGAGWSSPASDRLQMAEPERDLAHWAGLALGHRGCLRRARHDRAARRPGLRYAGQGAPGTRRPRGPRGAPCGLPGGGSPTGGPRCARTADPGPRCCGWQRPWPTGTRPGGPTARLGRRSSPRAATGARARPRGRGSARAAAAWREPSPDERPCTGAAPTGPA